MAKRQRAKLNIPIIIALILLCLTLFSLHFTSGLYARYTSKAQGGDSSKVASFGKLTLVEGGDFANAEKTAFIIPGVDLTKDAMVSFTASEVSVYVIVEIEVSEHWKTDDNYTFAIKNGDKVQLEWSVADDWIYIEDELLDDGRYAYYRLLEPNAALANEKIIAENGKITVSDRITRFETENLEDIEINLSAYAVQAGGTDFSALDAWKKVR